MRQGLGIAVICRSSVVTSACALVVSTWKSTGSKSYFTTIHGSFSGKVLPVLFRMRTILLLQKSMRMSPCPDMSVSELPLTLVSICAFMLSDSKKNKILVDAFLMLFIVLVVLKVVIVKRIWFCV